MTVEAIELLAERSARAHLQACHPSLTLTYGACVPYLAILLDLREVGICTCASPSPSPTGRGGPQQDCPRVTDSPRRTFRRRGARRSG